MTATPVTPHFIERDLPQVYEGRPAEGAVPVLVLPLPADSADQPERATQGEAAEVLHTFGLDLASLLADGASTRAGSVTSFPVAATDGQFRGVRRVVLLGVGDRSPHDASRAGAGLARSLTTAPVAACHGLRLSGRALRRFVTGFLLGSHQPVATGTRERTCGLAELYLGLDVGHDQPLIASAVSAARAGWLARDLAGTTSAVKNPPWLAEVAGELAADAGLEYTVRTEDDLRAEGFGGLIAVGGGSATPPRLVTVSYTPTPSSSHSPRGSAPTDNPAKHVVVVGKGITFDTGGLSLKPSEAMVPMRTDMTGAAVALATVLAAARDRLAVRVTAVLPLAENAIGAASYRPDDVLTIWGGRTVEIGNTDAEGRLVLADALAFAVATLAPDVLVDVATLTGAATLGLGRGHGALFTPDDDLAADLVAAGVEVGERLWRLPLVEDYRPAVRSTIADLAHIPGEHTYGGGGAVTAALFLQEFTRDPARSDTEPGISWAHLDIAGPARADKTDHELTKGPTGFGARVLLRWLAELAG